MIKTLINSSVPTEMNETAFGGKPVKKKVISKSLKVLKEMVRFSSALAG